MNVEVSRIEMTSRLYQAERELRNEVLLRPIGVPDYGWETRDKDSYHVVALLDGQVVGCVILYRGPDAPRSGQLMQMAVRDNLQGLGVGAKMVTFLLGLARAEGIQELTCHARDSAVGFYQRCGFQVYGDPFEEVGVGHHHMKINT